MRLKFCPKRSPAANDVGTKWLYAKRKFCNTHQATGPHQDTENTLYTNKKEKATGKWDAEDLYFPDFYYIMGLHYLQRRCFREKRHFPGGAEAHRLPDHADGSYRL
jgi:hypothetical protein